MQEIASELNGITSDRPATPDELDRAVKSQTLTLPGQWETNNAVINSIAEMVRFGYPDDHFDTYAAKIRSLNLSQVQAAAGKTLHPDNVVWVVVGNKEQIEPAIRELGFGPVREIDGDGNVMEKT